MHQVLRVSGLPHSDKIKYLNAEDATVAHVVSIREEVVATPGGAKRRRQPAAAAAPAEPEVAKKGKAEAGSAEAEAEAKK